MNGSCRNSRKHNPAHRAAQPARRAERGILNTAAAAAVLVFAAVMFAAACDNRPSGPPVIECGGAGEFPCPPTMYCRYGKDCGGIDHHGTCVPMPPDCPEEDKPVCGCNGATYDSACYAAASGISVDYLGPCIGKSGEEK